MARKARYKRSYRGLFETAISDGNGGRVSFRSSISSQDLERQVDEFKASLKAGEVVHTSNLTFIDYAKKWRASKKAGREYNTKAMYDFIIEKHLHILDGIQLSDIRNSHFQLVISNAIEHPRTCQQIYITFKQIIRSACNDNLISDAAAKKICDKIELPKYIKSDKRPLTEQESEAVKKLLKSDKLSDQKKAFLYIIMGCGLRRQEALALQPFNIDFKRKEISIHNVVIFVNNNPEIKTIPKSDRGIRKVPMPDSMIPFLTKYTSTNTGYLFTKQNRELITKSSYIKMWDSIRNAINLQMGGTASIKLTDGLTAHTFRHNYCTQLCYQIPTISTKKIAYLLGDTEKMVLEVYSHIIEEKEDVSQAVKKAISF